MFGKGLSDEFKRLATENEHLHVALQESLMLQSHYALILNRFDAGERMTFTTVGSWLDRLRMIGKLPKDTP